MRRPIYFAHGNGFPSESYGEMFHFLYPNFDIRYLPMVGHGDYPITDNWPHLVQEIINDIKRKPHPPVIGLGHSMGGVLLFMAACQAPELFEEIVLLDSPIPGMWRSWILRFVKRYGLGDKFMPIRRTHTRRIFFRSLDEAFHYFEKKQLFQDFTSESLRLYIEHGLIKTEKGYNLRFHRDLEAKIYLTVPDNLYLYERPAHMRSSLIYSTHSDIMSPFELSAMKRRYKFDLYPFHKGTHLFPFEYPEETAEMIQKIIFKEPV